MEKVKRVRLDTYLTEHGFFESRAKSQAAIMAGQVLADEQKIDKPGTAVKEGVSIRLLGDQLRYVSRGGLKLEKALQVFPLDLADKVCLDIGASTGGFTDCMLQNGAAKVFAVDVGYGQLAYKLRTDERVVCMEKTNVRYLTREQLGEEADFASVDVSFISLKLVLPALYPLLKDEAELVCLVKPQFEAGREKVGKKGVVRDPAVHREVLEQVTAFAAGQHYTVLDLAYSPIKGPEGNIEYLMYLKKNNGEESGLPAGLDSVIGQLVAHSHEELDR